jgi:hypothetical protein
MAIFDGFINFRGNQLRVPGHSDNNFRMVSEVLHNVRPEDILSYQVEDRVDSFSRVVTVKFMVDNIPAQAETGDTRDDGQTEDYLTRIGVR